MTLSLRLKIPADLSVFSWARRLNNRASFGRWDREAQFKKNCEQIRGAVPIFGRANGLVQRVPDGPPRQLSGDLVASEVAAGLIIIRDGL